VRAHDGERLVHLFRAKALLPFAHDFWGQLFVPLLIHSDDFLQGLPVHRCQRDPDFLLFNFLALSFSFVLFS
jgi:hypothetical protein